MKPPARLERSRTLLLLVDWQERLLPAMHEADFALTQAVRLARSAAVLGLPVLVTEQYPRGLGRTVPALAEVLGDAPVFEKTTFSALGAPGLRERMTGTPAPQVLLAGIESHVCVCQTALDLLALGRDLFVVADAVTSRTPANARLGLERVQSAGAVVVSTEMALFELLGGAGSPAFKAVQTLIK